MLKYLVVQLDDVAPSFCHYTNNRSNRKLIAFDALKNGLIWAMKENLMVQFVYPDYELPRNYIELIDSVEHTDIKPASFDADVSVFEGKTSLQYLKGRVYPNIVIRLSKDELFDCIDDILAVLNIQSSVNIVISNVETISEEEFNKYTNVLDRLSSVVIEKLRLGKPININLLTNRLILTSMNNCNAGDENITLAPDGNFYICPAFYLDGGDNIGNPASGVSIPNIQLYQLSSAPICRNCDAYQCRRCIWLNKNTTREVNTPSHEQCVMAHLERNASRVLLDKLKKIGVFRTNVTISEIDYLDPFDILK